jgi:hypothetical protein
LIRAALELVFALLVVVNRNLWDPFMPTHAFASIAWTLYGKRKKYPIGLVAGGMVDGTV